MIYHRIIQHQLYHLSMLKQGKLIAVSIFKKNSLNIL
jgi:hypothetical protein